MSADPKDPSQLSSDMAELLPKISMISSLLGGTDSMRAAGRKYLPPYPAESDAAYEVRLAGAVLLNGTAQTLGDLSAKPFTQPVEVGEVSLGGREDELLSDVDLRGNNLTVFCQLWFREALAKYFACVLVEYPKLEPRPDGNPRTLADDEAEGVRPYFVLIKPENVLAYYTELVGGREVPIHVRVLTESTVMDGFCEKVEQKITVLTPGLVEVYRKAEKGKDDWVLENSHPTGKDYIPIVRFTSGSDNKPPLLDLAHLNVAHWRSDSDQRNILSVARFPILAASGLDSDIAQSLVVSPNKVLATEDSAGRFYYVEHGGAAITSGEKDLERLEAAMRSYGSLFLRESTGTETATAKAIDTAESTENLRAMVERFEDSVALALDYLADWLGLGMNGGTVSCVKDYSGGAGNATDIPALQFARTNKDISRKTYLTALMEREILPEDYDIDEDAELIQAEMDMLLPADGAAPGGEGGVNGA